MGLFQVRCGVSGLSTGWRPDDGRGGIAMFLLERRGDAWLPWTPPVRGCYDGYGGIELWPDDITPETDWIGERLESLLARGSLVTSWPDDLTSKTALARSPVERILHHGAETAYNAVELTIDGAPVAACIVLERVVDAIAASIPKRHHDADAWFPAGGAGRRHFADLPHSARPQLARHATVLAYAQARGGLRPITSGEQDQPFDADHRRMVRAAWDRDDGPIRRMIDGLVPRWTSPWRKAADTAADTADHDHAIATTPPRPYTIAGDFRVGDVIEHVTFGLGRVESLEAVDKICVRFDIGARTMIHRRGR